MNVAEKKSSKKWLGDFLGSRDLSVFIFVMACTYALILAVFATAVPTPWVSRIAWLLPFKLLYLLFFVNLIICEIKWIPVIIRKCRKHRLPTTVEELQRFRHKITFQGSEFRVQSLGKYLKRRGFKVIETEVLSLKSHDPGTKAPVSSLLYAYKGRFSALGNLLFHAGFLFILLGGWLGFFRSFDGSAILMEGQDFMGTGAEYSTIASAMEPPSVSFRVEKISPQYWKDKLLFTDLMADVRYPSREGIESGVIRMAQPLRISGSKVSINGVGFVPMYILKDKNGTGLDSGYVRLNIFPPGTEDHFQIPGYPHQIFISFYPDHEIKEGKLTNRSMNPVNPVYYVKVFRNKVLSYNGIIRPEEEAYFEGLRFSLPEFKYWGMFRITKNPGFAYIWAAFILFGTGLAWSLLFYRKEIAVVKDGEALLIYCNSDYYQSLFEGRLRMFAEKGER